MISVTRPLDYEQVPNGMIHLRVMAKDGGNPALNSTVPVTVEVIVSTFSRNTHTLTQMWQAKVVLDAIRCDICHISFQKHKWGIHDVAAAAAYYSSCCFRIGVLDLKVLL